MLETAGFGLLVYHWDTRQRIRYAVRILHQSCQLITQWRIGGEHAVVTMAMKAWGGDELGQSVQ